MSRARFIELSWMDEDGEPITLELFESTRCPSCGHRGFLALDWACWTSLETHAPVECTACSFAYALPCEVREIVDSHGMTWMVREWRVQERTLTERVRAWFRSLLASVKGVV